MKTANEPAPRNELETDAAAVPRPGWHMWELPGTSECVGNVGIAGGCGPDCWCQLAAMPEIKKWAADGLKLHAHARFNAQVRR